MKDKLKELIIELGKADINHSNKTYNGITVKQTSDYYQQQLEQQYTNIIYSIALLGEHEQQLLLTAKQELLSNSIDYNSYIKSYRVELKNNPNKQLKEDLNYLLFCNKCKGVQLIILNKLIQFYGVKELINDSPTDLLTTTAEITEPLKQTVLQCEEPTLKPITEPTQIERYISIKQAIDIYKLPARIKDKQYREKVGFPAKQLVENGKITVDCVELEAWLKINE